MKTENNRRVYDGMPKPDRYSAQPTMSYQPLQAASDAKTPVTPDCAAHSQSTKAKLSVDLPYSPRHSPCTPPLCSRTSPTNKSILNPFLIEKSVHAACKHLSGRLPISVGLVHIMMNYDERERPTFEHDGHTYFVSESAIEYWLEQWGHIGTNGNHANKQSSD